MKKALLITSLLSIMLYAAPTACPKFYVEGEAPTIVNEKLTSKTKELCFEAFGVMHSGLSKTPIWSAEYLTATAIDADVQRMSDEVLNSSVENVI